MNLEQRSGLTPLEMSAEEFKKAGHELVDQIGDFLNSFDRRAVTKGKLPSQIRELLGDGSLPTQGVGTANELLNQSAQLLFENSLFNGHPMFFGYITSTPTPIGILSDMLAPLNEFTR